MRKLRRRRNKRQVHIVLGVSILLLTVMTVGYAAFSTNVTLNAKGKIIKKASDTLKENIVDTGDGLYDNGNSTYVFKGANPPNYLCMTAGTESCPEDSLYRIISIDADNTIKVIKNTKIGDIAWDLGSTTIEINEVTSGNRHSENIEDFCNGAGSTGINGCKSWGSSLDTFLNTAGTLSLTTTMPQVYSSTLYNLPSYDSYLNVYLNGGSYISSIGGDVAINGWYNETDSIDSDLKQKIDPEHVFNIGSLVRNENQTLATDLAQEQAYAWKGKIGLINATDYVKASSNSNCASAYDYQMNEQCYTDSNTHNWLYIDDNWWTINPASNTRDYTVFRVTNSGTLTGNNAENDMAKEEYGVRPVFYLKSDVELEGTGVDADHPFRIKQTTS